MITNTAPLWGEDTEAIPAAPRKTNASHGPRGVEGAASPDVPERGALQGPTLLSMLVDRTQRQVGSFRGARPR